MATQNYFLHCPNCGLEKTASDVSDREYSVRALHLPYFMCGECRLICIDKTTVRKAISAWRNTLPSRKDIPSYEKLYQEMMKTLGEIVDYYCQTAGYRRGKFKKIVH